jgi:polysaccharide pyruvyl transferase WcaK-like protein
MQVGGDNFTLDYGKPYGFMRLDDYLQHHDVPVMLWGASVGPFETKPAFAREMFDHLRLMRAIFLRESDSYEYLKQHGVDANLQRMSDPAFVMDPIEPLPEKIGCELPLDAIGLNLSPWMAKYVTGGDIDAWVAVGVEIVQAIADATGRAIVLVPHVTWSCTNDHAYLKNVAAVCREKGIQGVCCLGENLSAAEIKWVISRCVVFAGARTHSTIAALSTCVPTLSLAYSRKAMGLNQDIYGCQDYCIQPAEITPACVAKRIADLLTKRDDVSKHLAGVIPMIRENALKSGAILRQLIENQ